MNNHAPVVTRLLLARHGQTQASLDGIFSGSLEVPLTDIGHKQAHLLAARLKDEQISSLYCSPQLRAIQTATPIAATLELEIQQREELREMHFGAWEGHRKKDLLQTYAAELALWETGSWRAFCPQGETQEEVITRGTRCLRELLARHEAQTVLVVAHRTLIRLLVGHMLDMGLASSRALEAQTASITEIHIIGERTQLIHLNDTRHLI